MARQNRGDIFNPKEVCVMHCINRVRRAMPFRVDPWTGKSFEHRRQWVKQRLVFLAAHYGIDVLGYAARIKVPGAKLVDWDAIRYFVC